MSKKFILNFETQTYLQDAVQICAAEDAVVLQFSNDAQVTSFLNLMKEGEQAS